MWAQLTSDFHQQWQKSKVFRVLVVLSGIYFLFRLLVHFYSAIALFYPSDLALYLEAGDAFLNQQNIFPAVPLEVVDMYNYGLVFAAFMAPVSTIDPNVVVVVKSILHLIAYVGLFVTWYRLFGKYNLPALQSKLIALIPLWLVYGTFWSDMSFMNIFFITAWIATLLFEALLDKRLLASIILLSLLLQTKPHWTFALAIPFLFRDWGFMLKVLGASFAIYLGSIAALMVVAPPAYVLAQFEAYITMLANFGTHPMRGPEMPFMGYNHSILQIVTWLGGSFTLARIVKYAMLIPLGLVALKVLSISDTLDDDERSLVGMELFFALYLGVFIWLDVVWEVSLSIVIVSYLVIMMPKLRALWWAVFLPTAFLDMWQLISFGILGDAAFSPEDATYLITDPSIYVPLMMIVIVVFHYGLLANIFSRFTESVPLVEDDSRQVSAA